MTARVPVISNPVRLNSMGGARSVKCNLTGNKFIGSMDYEDQERGP